MKTRPSFVVASIGLLAYIAADYWLWASGKIHPGQFLFGLSILLLLCCMGVIHLLTKRNLLLLLLAGVLTFQASAQTNAPLKLFTVQDPQPQVTACELVIGVIVIAFPAYFLYRFCTARFWTNIPPPPPPAPAPTNNVPTNRAPHTFFPAFALNQPPSGIEPVAACALPDIPDLWSGTGAAFNMGYYGRYPGVQSSTNLIDWANFRFDTWVSQAGALSVIYDGDGVPVQTNYVPLFSDMESRAMIPPLTNVWMDSSRPCKFFRYHE